MLMGLLCILALVLARLQTNVRNDGKMDVAGRTLGALTYPVSERVGSGLDANHRFWSSVFATNQLKAENERLKALERSWNLYAEVTDAQQNEISELRKMIGLSTPPGHQRIAAEVIAFDSDTHRMTLNRGSDSKIEPGLAVVNSAGLVGVVQSVDRNRSHILLVSSPAVRIGGMILRKPPIVGLIRGMGTERMRLEFMDNTIQAQPGDKVVTSYHSEKLPAYLPIGQVIRQQLQAELGRQEVIVAPNVRFSEVREVFVYR